MVSYWEYFLSISLYIDGLTELLYTLFLFYLISFNFSSLSSKASGLIYGFSIIEFLIENYST